MVTSSSETYVVNVPIGAPVPAGELPPPPPDPPEEVETQEVTDDPYSSTPTDSATESSTNTDCASTSSVVITTREATHSLDQALWSSFWSDMVTNSPSDLY